MPDRRHPMFLLPALVVIIVIGIVSVFLTLQQGREAALARSEQVEETTRMVEDLADEFAGRSDDARHQRAVVCDIVHAIAVHLELAPPDCPEVPLDG